MFRVKQILAALSLCLLSSIAYAPSVQAAQANSTNYGVSEVNFGSGGSLQSCSGQYCAKQSAGELVVGESGSANYSARGGANTNREPVLEMIVSGTGIDLGVLDPGLTRSGTTTFSVRTFPASGYSVFVDGNTPRNKSNGNVLAPISGGDISRPGTEQFGINLRQNTAPNVGADVQQIPDSTFASGAPATGYGTQDSFRYVGGEVIATSPKGSGQTNYTISAIANITTSTPSGSYGGRLVLIAVPTF